MEDEFVIFLNNSNQSNITIDVRHPGSHDPGCCGESGWQHLPTVPDTALRYSGEKDNGDTSGSGQDTLQAAMPRSVSTLKMGDAGRQG